MQIILALIPFLLLFQSDIISAVYCPVLPCVLMNFLTNTKTIFGVLSVYRIKEKELLSKLLSKLLSLNS